MRGLTACSLDDIILLSDVDEIPKGKSISQAIEMLEDEKKAVSFQQVMYRFFINRQDPLMWLGSLATTYQVMKETNNPEELRRDRTDYGGYQRGEWASIEDGGWHFTSMGGFSRVVEKIKGFSHTPEEGAVPPASEVEFESWALYLTPVSIDKSFPRYVQENQEYFMRIGLLI